MTDILGVNRNDVVMPFWVQFMLQFFKDVLCLPNAHKEFEDYIILYFKVLLKLNYSSIHDKYI